jgi:hypothetical protein
MQKLSIIFTFAFFIILGSNGYAQQTPPPGAGDKDLRDTDVKRRSIEMERVERDARKGSGKNAKNTPAKNEDPLAAKYEEIKTDYEQIQLMQDAVVKAYQTGSKIDYAQIGKSAREMNRSASRLNSNLFPLSLDEKEEAKKEEKDKAETERKPAKSVRDLIIELDNTIGSFAASPMFQNLRVIEPKVSAKTKLDLEKIAELSRLLEAEARKMVTTEK